jgi:hypothetical protein
MVLVMCGVRRVVLVCGVWWWFAVLVCGVGVWC